MAKKKPKVSWKKRSAEDRQRLIWKSKLRSAKQQAINYLRLNGIEVPEKIGEVLRLFASELGFQFKIGGWNSPSLNDQLVALYEDPNFTAIGPRPATFYLSGDWRAARYEVFKALGRKCLKCGETKNLHIDHIKPRSKYPELELDIDNLQVLCRSCNIRKSNREQIDYRTKAAL